jgi:hypothetical protein
MAIAHVNSVATSNLLGGSSAFTLDLPESIVAGNLLVAFVGVRGGTSTPGWSDGWTPAGSQVIAGSLGVTAVAYRVATGSDTEPVITVSSSNSSLGIVCQFSGASDIGALEKNTDISSGENVDAFTSTGSGSASAYFWFLFTGNTTERLPTPSGWSRISTSDAWSGSDYNHLDIGIKTLGSSGSSSGAISENSGWGHWSLFNVEIKAGASLDGSRSASLDPITVSATAASGNVSVKTLDPVTVGATAITGAGGAATVTLSPIGVVATAISSPLINEDHAVAVGAEAILSLIHI